jgi:transposase
LLRLDEVVPVRIPSAAEEAARDLVRTREAARADLMRARHRLSKLLLRHGIVYYDGKAWTERHDRWLHHQRFDAAPTQSAFEDAYEAVVLATARRARLDEKITALAADSEFSPMTRRLACLRGISTLTGFALAVEIGDWDRFTGASIGAYLGLVPSEYSSGTSRAQGAITKTGNTHVRRLLVEAAWHHRSTYRPGAVLSLALASIHRSAGGAKAISVVGLEPGCGAVWAWAMARPRCRVVPLGLSYRGAGGVPGLGDDRVISAKQPVEQGVPRRFPWPVPR